MEVANTLAYYNMAIITLVSSNLACKYYTKVEVNGTGKHTSLLQYGNNYSGKLKKGK